MLEFFTYEAWTTKAVIKTTDKLKNNDWLSFIL